MQGLKKMVKEFMDKLGFENTSTISHIVTLQVLMEESSLRGKGFTLLRCRLQESF